MAIATARSKALHRYIPAGVVTREARAAVWASVRDSAPISAAAPARPPSFRAKHTSRLLSMALPASRAASIPPWPAPYIRASWGPRVHRLPSRRAHHRPHSSKRPAISPPNRAYSPRFPAMVPPAGP